MTGTAGSAPVPVSFLYKLITRLAQFVILRFRADVDKEVEILVLRHQLAVLRRQVGKVGTTPADRAVLALLSRSLAARRSGVSTDQNSAPVDRPSAGSFPEHAVLSHSKPTGHVAPCSPRERHAEADRVCQGGRLGRNQREGSGD
jgi:hypothetical protein